jgi:hypothetical protein
MQIDAAPVNCKTDAFNQVHVKENLKAVVSSKFSVPSWFLLMTDD